MKKGEKWRGRSSFSPYKCYTFRPPPPPLSLSPPPHHWAFPTEERDRDRIDEREGGTRSVKISLQLGRRERGGKGEALMLWDGLLSVKGGRGGTFFPFPF